MGVMGYGKTRDGRCCFCGSKEFKPVCPRCNNLVEQKELEECVECGAILFKEIPEDVK